MRNQQEEAIDTLQIVQQMLGQMGFTMTSDGKYYKDFGLTDGSIARLTPVFDKGISINMAFKLTGFTLTTQKHVSIIEGLSTPTSEFPMECMDDVNQLVSSLSSAARQPLTESFMIMQTCNQCNTEVDSFIHIRNEYICLRCAGIEQNVQT